MRKALPIILLLILAAEPASARHWHWGGWHRHHRHYSAEPRDPAAALDDPGTNGMDVRGSTRERYNRSGTALDDLVPANWKLQPPDQQWKGKRFLSPDGSGWFAAYTTAAGQETASAHMKAFAFADGETIALLQGEKDWIVVAGTKQDKVFYRKAVVACGGQSWHHVAFEYPAGVKSEMAQFIRRASKYVERTNDEGCGGATPSSVQPTER